MYTYIYIYIYIHIYIESVCRRIDLVIATAPSLEISPHATLIGELSIESASRFTCRQSTHSESQFNPKSQRIQMANLFRNLTHFSTYGDEVNFW